MCAHPSPSTQHPGPDIESRAWLARLHTEGSQRDKAIAELHELLLRAARFEINRRRAGLPHLRGGDYDDLAQQSAGDALVAIMSKLDDYRGESRFTTWAAALGRASRSSSTPTTGRSLRIGSRGRPRTPSRAS
jgi:RNA polymerase sigma-70 factor (ECF subfamily)